MKDKSLLARGFVGFFWSIWWPNAISPETPRPATVTRLMLLLPFASKQGCRAIDRMTVENLTPAIVRKFLDHLERDRQCSGVTRNQTACDHSFAGALHRYAFTCSFGMVRSNTGGTIQEDRQDRDRISREGRDGRPVEPAGPAHSLGARDHALLAFYV